MKKLNLDKETNEQKEAINKDNSNILVSAGAGSGKTAVLSLRVIRKVLDGIDIDKILILTFTNLAAKEMKTRIRKKLIEYELFDQVEILDKSYITTFDSYSLDLVKRYSNILNIDNNIDIVDSNLLNTKKIELLDDLFNKYYLENDPLFKKLINTYCFKDDYQLKSNILNLNNKLDLLYEKNNYLDSYLDKYYSNEFINNMKKEYYSLIKNDQEIIKNDLLELANAVSSDKYEIYYNLLNDIITCSDINKLNTYLDIKLPRVDKDNEYEKSVKNDISEVIKKLKANLLDIDQEIINYKNTYDYLNIIIRIIKDLDKEIKNYKLTNNMFEFVDIAKLALKLVKENDDIKEEIKNSFKEIMIDEYQDTSDLQEEFIQTISTNNVYMVGDIKQSIYRFRNANPNNFKDKYNLYKDNINGLKIDLNKNFRSRFEVLDNINLIFDNVMNLKYGGSDFIKTDRMSFGNNLYSENINEKDYNMEFLNYIINKDSKYKNYKKSEIEAFIIGNDIINKINNNYMVYDKDKKESHKLRYSDITILIDRSTNFFTYKKIFEYLNIPLTVYRNVDVTMNDEVFILRAILKLIQLVKDNNYNEEYNHYIVSVLRSYLYNLDDDYIYDIVTNNKKDFDLLFKIKNIVNNINNISLKGLIKEIIEVFDFNNKLLTVDNIKIRLGIIEYFTNLADNLMKINFNLNDLNKYLDYIIDDYYKNQEKSSYRIEIPVSIDSYDSVKIMTIHQSKGLEYNICYYPELYNSFNLSDLNSKFVYDHKYGIVIPSYLGYFKDSFIKILLKDKYKNEEISEKIRLFYVSLTRAKEKMIFIGSINSDYTKLNDNIRRNYNSFQDIIDSISIKMNKYIKDIDLDKINIVKEYNIFNKQELIKNNNVLLVKEVNIDSSLKLDNKYSKDTYELIDKEIKDNMEYGKYIHNVFELVDFKNPNFTLINENAKKYLINFLKQDILKNIANSKIYKEYEFYYEYQNNKMHGIIDLMIEYDDYIDIIDYKLKNIKDDNYIKQLKGYKEYIFNKTNKKVNIYLYSILDDKMESLNG